MISLGLILIATKGHEKMDSNEQFRHTNINLFHDEHLTVGQRVADRVAACMGSMGFVIVQTVILAAWIIWNSVPLLPHFDAAPFILLNLCLSFQAGYAAPFILVSQNRQAEKDRLKSDEDYRVNVKSEHEVKQILKNIQSLAVRIEAQEARELDLLRKMNLLLEQTRRDDGKSQNDG